MKEVRIITKDESISWEVWKSQIRALLTAKILNSHLFLITLQPQNTSLGNEFEDKFEMIIGNENYLISEIGQFSKETAFEIVNESEFYRDLLAVLLYDFDEMHNKFVLIDAAVKFCNKFQIHDHEGFDKGKLLFTVDDGEILVEA